MGIRQCVPALAVVLAAGLGLPGQQADQTVTLRVVNYQQLGDAVKDLRGKVVVVDFWADT